MVRSALLLAVGAAGAARAQCFHAGPPDSIPGVAGGSSTFIADATLWDPDGPGPAPTVLVVVGYFSRAGHTSAWDVATWDGQRWQPLGRLGTQTNALTVCASPTGELICGGGQGMISGSCLARWNGSAWEAIPATGSRIDDSRFTPDGDLLIAGSFSSIAGTTAANIAIRRGGAWSPLGAGLGPGVQTMTTTMSGDLIAGGDFTSAGGSPAAHVARWDGSSWSAMGDGFDRSVWALLTQPDGSVIAGGGFNASGEIPLARIASWDGSAWSPIGAGIPSTFSGVYSLARDQDGSLIAGGEFGQGPSATHAMLWDGAAWTDIGASLNGSIYGLLPTASGMYAVGDFTQAGGWPALGIARWSAGSWTPTPTDPYGRSLTALAVTPSALYAAGVFSTQGAFDQYRVAQRQAGHWAALTPPLDGPSTLLAMPDGSLIAAGRFTRAGEVEAAHIARWDGSAWHALGQGLDDNAYALALMPDGSVIVAGDFLHAGGSPATRIARWDGSAWHALGAGITGFQALTALPDGRILVSKEQGNPGLIAWDGHTWAAVQGPSAQAFAADATGDLYARSNFGIARLHAGEWVSVGHGLTFASLWTLAFAPLPESGMLAVGTMLTASGAPCRGIARADEGGLANANADAVAPYQPTDLAALGDGSFAMISNFGDFSILTPTSGPVERPIFVDEPPPLTTACPGASVTLTVRATAGLPVQYAWYAPGSFGEATRIGTGPTVTLTAPSTARQRVQAWCIATTADCSAVTETGTFEVLALTPDVNRDGFVDFFDYIFFADAFRLGGLPVADFNADGFIDFFDYLDFVDAFERGC